MATVYVVIYAGAVVGVSARLQGAEVLRTDYAHRLSTTQWPHNALMRGNTYNQVYDATRIENHHLEDE